MAENVNRLAMEAALLQLGQGGSAAFIDLFAEDIEWTIRGTTPWSRTYSGKPAVLRMLRSLFALIDGNYRMHAHRVLADASADVIVVEGQGENLLKSGQRYDNSYCWVCHFAQGRLRELVEYMDTALVLRVFGSP